MENYESDIEKRMETAWGQDFPPVPKTQIKNSWSELESTIRSRSPKRSFKWAIAAAIMLLLLPALYLLSVDRSTIEINNYTQLDKEFILPDSSIVILKPNSTVSYNKKFSKREVALSGQAFFDVVKDSLKEFTVETSRTSTRVLGTSFLVTENEDLEKTEVSLYSGRILMSLKDTENRRSWAIIPGESFLLDKGKVQVKKFETDLSFSAGNKYSDLNNIELEKLFHFIEERFGYQFETNEMTKNKLVTLRINKSDSLGQILKVLSLINDVNFEINESEKTIVTLKKEKK
ncbi:FecR family protein [Euzebyella marina]|uniref:FecR family protein n=1 Tax=Euzebyella marina TaxID=1761453 RepID=A0A3G2LAM5_9FLAO|nr:FecR family protein [Euzebyella marina]AYN69300.1 FecR family protein [Euzebyella marina]